MYCDWGDGECVSTLSGLVADIFDSRMHHHVSLLLAAGFKKLACMQSFTMVSILRNTTSRPLLEPSLTELKALNPQAVVKRIKRDLVDKVGTSCCGS